MDKKSTQLRKLMELNNPKADAYLINFANNIFADIKKSKNNESSLESLDLLGDFVYKVPKETIKIVKYIIEEEPKPVKLYKSPYVELKGKSHKDLVLKCIELLGNIKYIVPDEMLKLVSGLSINEDLEIKNKALDIVKNFSQYDYNVLTKSKIGYSVQRKALDFVLEWSLKEQLQHIDFVETILKELLGSSIEGTTSGLNANADYTITMHFGAVSPTDFLKRMRQETIDLVYVLYKSTGNSKLKLRLVKILDETTRTPSNVEYGEDVLQMIADDLKYLTGIYRKIVFGEEKEKMIELLGIVATIEERLYGINKNEKKKNEESEKLRKDILQNEFYRLFRLLVGDFITYYEHNDWITEEKIRSEEFDKLIGSIEKAQLEEWFNKLNKIASQYTIVDEWKFNTFKSFLRKLSEKKPQIADELLERAFENNSPLKHFTSAFLEGFRIGAHFEVWDKYLNEIINTKDIALVTDLVSSLNLPPDVNLEKLIREKDIDFFENINKRKAQLSFLREVDDRFLEYALFNALLRNFRRSLKRVEPMIIEEIKGYPKYLDMFFSELSKATHMGWINIKELHPETVEFLKEKMVELSDIDWHVQKLLQAIGERDGLKAVLDVFMKRIKKDAKRKVKEGWQIDERYDAIPYHFNPDLNKFMAEHPDYEKVTSEWTANMTTGWSIYNWNVGHFLQNVEKGFDEVLNSLIQKDDDENLMKAACAMQSIDSVDFDICIEIIRRTDNKNIIDLVEANMYTTGVVSGEYGISKTYEKKAEQLKKYLVDESERVRIFAKRMIKSFKESAKRERQQADEEKQLRRIEFEG
jgi:hypothetical protein